MKKKLFFLQLGEPTCKEHFLEHITELIHIPIDHNSDHNELFEKLQKRFESDPEKIEGVNDWIQFNKELQDDDEIFKSKILDEDNSRDEKWFVIFNMANE